MNWKILKNTLVVDDMEIKEFPYPIRIAKEIQGTVIVVLDIPTGCKSFTGNFSF